MIWVVSLIIIVATWVVAKEFLRRLDRTLSLPMPPIPANPDPYETACLTERVWVGRKTSLVVMIVSLTQRGYLQRCWYKNKEGIRATSSCLGTLTPPPWFSAINKLLTLLNLAVPAAQASKVESFQESSLIPGRQPSPAEKELLHWFSEPRTGYDVFWTPEPQPLIQPHLFNCEVNLYRIGLLTPPDRKRAGNEFWLVGTLIIAGAVLLAWGLSESRGEGLLFMLVLGILFAAGILGVICTNPPHLSALGSEYMKQMRSRFEGYKVSAHRSNRPMLPLLVALFGMEVLEKTELEWLIKLKVNSMPPSGD